MPPRHGAANAESEGGQHLAQRPARTVQHDPRTDLHRTHTELAGRRCRRSLPCHAHLRQEVVPRRGILVEWLLTVRSVVTDRRGADKRSRALVAVPVVHACQPLDQVAGSHRAAVADRLLGLRAPALRDGLARQVQDRITSGQRLGWGWFAHQLPAHRLDIAEPGACPIGIASQDGHLGFALQQRAHERRAQSAPSPR